MGCSNLGILHEKGLGVAEDLDAAVRLYRKACDRGGGPGCNNLGVLVEHGLGTGKTNLAGALALYRKGCAGGSARACANATAVGDLLKAAWQSIGALGMGGTAEGTGTARGKSRPKPK
jgi:TPR repeat protein